MLSQIFNVATYEVNLWALPLLCTAIVICIMTLRNLVNEGITKVSISFSFLLLTILVWFLAFFFMYSATDSRVALAWAKTSYLGVAFIPATLYFFTISVLNLYEKRKRIGRSICLFSLLFFIVISGTDIIVDGVRLFSWGYYPHYSLWSFVFLVPFFLTMTLSFYEFWRVRRRLPVGSTQHRRISLFVIALGVGSIASIDYLPKFGLAVHPVGYLAIFVAIGIMQTAIWKYRLVDITPRFAAASIIDAMDDALLVIDAEGFIRLFNHSSISLFGITGKELLGKHIARLISDVAFSDIVESVGSGIRDRYELVYQNPESGLRVISLSASFMKDERGQVLAIVCIVRDITDLKQIELKLRDAHEALERKVEERTIELRGANEQLMKEIQERTLAEDALRRSEERYALAARGANDGLWDWDIADDSIYFSGRWKTLLGYGENEIGSSVEEWFNRVHPDDIEQLRHEISIHLDRATSHFQSEYRILHKDGTYRWMLTRGVAVRNERSIISRMAGSQTDITERRQREDKLLHDAFHDSLTNLPNRALLMDRLDHALKMQKRNPALIFAVLFLDLDRFKVINDSLGHGIGDQLLVAASSRLVDAFRNSDTVAHIGETFARLGGDEFVVMMEGIKTSENAENVAVRIQRELEAPFNIEGHEIFITASIGIALSSVDYTNSEEILRDADTALYRAKELGKARHEMFTPGMHITALKTLHIEMDLRRAIERHEFRLHYQPIVSLHDGKLQRLEALIRWEHPVHGIVSPMDFIPIAEENGLILSIGDWVLAAVCTQIRQWQDAGLPQLRVAVNISTLQLRQKQFPATVARYLRESGLEAQFLELEITESLMMESPEEALTVLNQLSALGVHLSLDDFGTGYSSLSYLPRFPIDTIKIDRSFISKISLDPDTMQIVVAIVALCQKMGKNIIAEGIETWDQRKLLEEIRCSYGQGYLFSKPLDDAAIVSLMQTSGR